MADPLSCYRTLARCPADAIRWACVLEATAPKAGNVYPGRPFDNLVYSDFMIAAEITAALLDDENLPPSTRMLEAVQQSCRAVGSNANLGIVLLLGPLAAADPLAKTQGWLAAIKQTLSEFQPDDGQLIYRAIMAAAPGGLGNVPADDVRSTSGPTDIVAAMRRSADRDRIARQYATGYADLFDNILPVVESSIHQTGDLLTGIAAAQLRLLASEVDSLIARKNGIQVAEEVRYRAAAVNIDNPGSVEDFDRWLRRDGNRLNPGTTADLIAASLYLLLRGDSPDSQ